ncbi:MAG: glycosyltransferase family 2 protein [Candidatus Nanoarchaeia archaeon]
MKTMIIIAAYNEEKAIGDVLKDLRDHDYKDVVVVDDGSSDNTAEAAKEAHVVRHAINRGQGAALRTGLQYALDHGADIIVTFDADGQHQAKDLPKLVDPIKEGKVKAVLGSRFIGGLTKMPWKRKLLLKGSIIVQYLFYGIKLTDAHSGLRALHKDAASKIDIRSDGMAHSHEFAEQIHKHKITFKEAPIDVRYTEYTMSKGHGSFSQAFKVLFAMLKDKFVK